MRKNYLPPTFPGAGLYLLYYTRPFEALPEDFGAEPEESLQTADLRRQSDSEGWAKGTRGLRRSSRRGALPPSKGAFGLYQIGLQPETWRLSMSLAGG